MPRTFSGVSNDKGVYDPAPRDFVCNVWNYLTAEERDAGNTLSEIVKIVLTSTLLEQSVAMWYEQVNNDYQAYLNDPNATGYNGPLSDIDTFLQAFLEQFEDVDIQKTAIAKIQSMQQGTQSAEVHTRLFKDWASHTGFNDIALIEFYKKSLKPAIRDKVNGQGQHWPTMLQRWYEDTVLFDRQWREDHPDWPTLQATAGNTRNQAGGTNNSLGQSTRGQQCNTNQSQPRNSNWPPWGAPQQQARAPARPPILVWSRWTSTRPTRPWRATGVARTTWHATVTRRRRKFGNSSAGIR